MLLWAWQIHRLALAYKKATAKNVFFSSVAGNLSELYSSHCLLEVKISVPRKSLALQKNLPYAFVAF